MKRRAFIALIGAAAAWPRRLSGQEGERMRRVGVLMALSATDPESSRRLTAFRQALQELGWTEGRNVRLDTRLTAGNLERLRRYAAGLVALEPDVIVAIGSTTLAPLEQATRTVPIVFALAADPLGGGFVENLARPDGNATGFILFDYGISGTWLQLLKEIAPRIARAAFLHDQTSASGLGQSAALKSVAPSVGVEVSPINVRDVDEIERAVAAFARAPDGGLIVTTTPVAIVNRDLIIGLAARYELPAIYWDRLYVAGGGLISYGAETLDQCRQAAVYVDRILKGESPADLPVQVATKHELAINLTTAKALGLEIPPTFLARADEVIE
jgi:putative tryptophan/tyrosine transport system substrate-binding protein